MVVVVEGKKRELLMGKGDVGAGARRHGDCFSKGWRSRDGVGWGGVIRSYDGSGRAREKGCVGSYRRGDGGIIGGLLVGSLLGVWGDEGGFGGRLKVASLSTEGKINER